MLQLDTEQIGHFGEMELSEILESGGWDAILPKSLSDEQLICVSDQLRAMLWGEATRGPDGEPNAAMAIALLLMAKAHPASSQNGELKFAARLEQLQEVLMLLSVAADREIVNRLLNRANDEETLTLLMGIEAIMVKPGPEKRERKPRSGPPAAA